jgi:hypothetical protein
MYPRVLRPAKGDPLLHQQWNSATSSLRIQILEAISAVDWTAIDILSVGLEEPEAQFHNTLLIAVKAKSLPWSRGNTLALQCKAILEEHGIKNMHCEIRESDVILLTDESLPKSFPPSTTSSDDESEALASELQLSSGPISFDDHPKCRANLTDCLGTTISTKDRGHLSGTKGIYLSLSPQSDGGKPATVILTCRHVTIDSETDGLKEYRHEQSGSRREVIQMDQTTFHGMVDGIDSSARTFADMSRKGRLLKNAARVNIYGGLAKQSRALSRTMKQYADPSSRVIGHLLYASAYMTCSSDSGARWLRDWALIELHPSRHQASMSSISNKVFTGVLNTESFKERMKDCQRGWQGIRASTPDIDDYTFQLKNVVIPTSELFKPPQVAYYSDEEDAILVAKYGAMTGLTVGLGSTLKSLTRRTGEGDIISEEWCIISAASVKDRDQSFSDKGDSGSCIWDLDGRVAGLLTAGCCSQDMSVVGIDITYAQPVERLLADIQAQGYDVSLI